MANRNSEPTRTGWSSIVRKRINFGSKRPGDRLSEGNAAVSVWPDGYAIRLALWKLKMWESRVRWTLFWTLYPGPSGTALRNGH